MSVDGLRVLIVEDEQVSQRALRLLLEDRGMNAEVVGTAEEAISLLKSAEPFDVVLLDVDLPGGLDGLDLLEQLSELSPTARPVLLTGAALERLSRAVTRGVPYLRKPIDFQRLLTILGDSPSVH